MTDLLFEEDDVGLEVAGLLGVLVQDCDGRLPRAVQELDVDHRQLLQADVERLVQLPGIVDRDDLRTTFLCETNS